MNRFGKKKEKSFLKNIFISAAAFTVVLLLLLSGLSRVSQTTSAEETRSLETAVNHGIMHCYAVEGRYPESLAYLEDHYGITYNKDKYYIDYRPVAANIMPDVTIIPLEDTK